ncbi:MULTISPECIES: hypothetical protein [Vibrio]|uniref:hypothetical protein n=1 Tax=Vibrio TaxID=662 RepID=UPI002074EEAE|nr:MULTISPECIES: hypothetical protein [Vibrio]USD35465.1 hypothetical protein J8Z27_22870 [Vibrio sp. SCSIO 43186]USD72589.1 hypothetical protein J4N41_22875 [Vibrio sp. SCSIO 43139]
MEIKQLTHMTIQSIENIQEMAVLDFNANSVCPFEPNSNEEAIWLDKLEELNTPLH